MDRDIVIVPLYYYFINMGNKHTFLGHNVYRYFVDQVKKFCDQTLEKKEDITAFQYMWAKIHPGGR